MQIKYFSSFEIKMVTICTTNLSIKHFVFPQIVFLSYLKLSQQIRIISLNKINHWVIVMKTQHFLWGSIEYSNIN
jgi:hypothetical protein